MPKYRLSYIKVFRKVSSEIAFSLSSTIESPKALTFYLSKYTNGYLIHNLVGDRWIFILLRA